MSDETRATDRPATFRDVFASREFRFLYGANVLSWFGDYLARAAVTALVFDTTKSVVLSAIAFGLTFLPWLAGGPVLAAIAERMPFRRVIVGCDVIRAGLMLLVAIPNLRVWTMLTLLFAAAMANPPFQAARSALLPQVLTGDRYVVGLGLFTSSGQAAQLAGYVVGGAIAPFYPRIALLLNAGTFALSAVLVRFGVADRAPVARGGERQHLARETADGFRIVFGTRVLRAIALVVFSSMLFAVVPEGLAAAWAGKLNDGGNRGAIQAMIMVATPLGFIIGGLLIGRLVRPDNRNRLIRPFAIITPLALVPALFTPPPILLALLAGLCGFAVAGMLPAANGLFVKALPASFRARAFGVMQGGMQITQAVAVVVTGALAEWVPLPVVVGLWGVGGVVLLIIASLRWPSQAQFAEATAAAAAANTTAAATGGSAAAAGTRASDAGAPATAAPPVTPVPASDSLVGSGGGVGSGGVVGSGGGVPGQSGGVPAPGRHRSPSESSTAVSPSTL